MIFNYVQSYTLFSIQPNISSQKAHKKAPQRRSPTLMHKRNFKTVIVITVIEQHFEMEISCQNQSVPFRVLLGAEHLQECYFLCTFAAANQS